MEVDNLIDSKYDDKHRNEAVEVDPKVKENWEKVQDKMRHEIITSNPDAWNGSDSIDSCIKLVAGLDISYPKDAHDKGDSDAYAAVVICKYPSMEILFQEVKQIHLSVPYVPGFLAFREFEPLSKLLEKVVVERPDLKPDVILCDGNGLLHPQACGVASHIGLYFNIPTIGVAKNLFVMEGIDCTKNLLQNQISVGDYIYLRDKQNSILGMALKTNAQAKNPIYVSIGHKINMDTCRKIILKCCKYRIPEPLRFADQISREFIRKLDTT